MTRQLLTRFLAVAVLGLAFGATATASRAQEIREPELSDPLKLGKFTYALKCASCHGATLQGTDKGPPFLSRVYHPGHHADASFFNATRNGARAHHWKFGDMPPVENISDEQIGLVVDYIRAVQRANGVF